MSFSLTEGDRAFLAKMRIADSRLVEERLVGASIAVGGGPTIQVVSRRRHEEALARQAELHAAVMAEKDERALELVRTAQRLAVERDDALARLGEVDREVTRWCRIGASIAAVLPWVALAGGWLWAK